MFVEELSPLIINIDTNFDTNDELYNNKLQLLGIRKSIILWHITDSFYELLVCVYLTPYYSVSLFIYNILFWKTIHFYKAVTPFYGFTIFIKFVIKVTMLSIIKYWIINLISCIFLLFNLVAIKLMYQYHIILNEELTEQGIESLISGWRPRIIQFLS